MFFPEARTAAVHFSQTDLRRERDSKKYQVEVELLQDTDTYVHVMVAVDDGLLPASISPVTATFTCDKPHSVRECRLNAKSLVSFVFSVTPGVTILRVAKTFAWIFVGIILACCLLVVSIDERLPDSPVIRMARARAQISVFITALDVYRLDTGQFPTTAQGLQALRHNPGVQDWGGPYLPVDIPLDPWKREYQYRRDAEGKAEVLSFGPKSDINSSPIVATTAADALVRE